jgi:hypothetical protein
MSHPDPTDPEWESIADTFRATGECRQTINNKIKRGCFVAVKSGRRTLVNVPSRRAYYNSLPPALIATPPKPTAA